jgi:hypothetical protein
MAKPLPKKDHKISKDEARKYTKRFRDKVKRKEPLPPLLPLAFHRDGYDRILSQPGCVAIRAYPALHEDGRTTLVLVGVDADGNDLVDGELAQESETCPPFCSDGNILNGDG